ncbi:MAG: MarR family transcriptional regulator [Actinomycetes bacterium]
MAEITPHTAEERCAAFASDERIVMAGNLISATHRLTRALDQHLVASTGLSLTFYEAMVHVRRSAENRLTMGELANELALTTGGATRLVDRLIEHGLVARVHCPSDRRTLYVELTEAGVEALEQATEHYLEALDCLLIAPVASLQLTNLNEALAQIATAPYRRSDGS